MAIDRYGCPRPDRDERWYRGRLLAVALERGCRSDFLGAAYNMTPDAVVRAARRYREEHGKQQ